MEHNKEQKGKNDIPKIAAATKGFSPIPTEGVVRPSNKPHLPTKKVNSEK